MYTLEQLKKRLPVEKNLLPIQEELNRFQDLTPEAAAGNTAMRLNPLQDIIKPPAENVYLPEDMQIPPTKLPPLGNIEYQPTEAEPTYAGLTESQQQVAKNELMRQSFYGTSNPYEQSTGQKLESQGGRLITDPEIARILKLPMYGIASYPNYANEYNNTYNSASQQVTEAYRPLWESLNKQQKEQEGSLDAQLSRYGVIRGSSVSGQIKEDLRARQEREREALSKKQSDSMGQIMNQFSTQKLREQKALETELGQAYETGTTLYDTRMKERLQENRWNQEMELKRSQFALDVYKAEKAGENAPTAQKDYQLAKQEGFRGNYQDYLTWEKSLAQSALKKEDPYETYKNKGYIELTPEQIKNVKKEEIIKFPDGKIFLRPTELEKERAATGIVAEYEYYVKQENILGRKPVSFNDYQTMDANRKRSITNNYLNGGLTQQQFNRLNVIADNARQDSNIKDFSAIRASYETARGARQSNNSAGDIVLMRMLAKITDPTTGVREEEYRTFQAAAGTLPQYGMQVTAQMIGKGQLTEYGRNALLSEVSKIYKQREAAYNNSIKNYEGLAKKSGGSLEDIMPIYTAPEIKGQEETRRMNGKTYIKTEGGWLLKK